MPIEVRYHRFKKAMELVNRVFTVLFHVPEGYCLCPDCKAVRAVHPFSENKTQDNFVKNANGEIFLFSYCAKCKGAGYINPHHPTMDEGGTNDNSEYLVLPGCTSEFTNVEIASIIFYLVYDRHAYSGLDISLNNNDGNGSKASVTMDFISYFNRYKMERDQRKKFIKKNFNELQTSLKRRIKTYTVNKNRFACIHCDGEPFDIIHEWSLDTIVLSICGNCCGVGIRQGEKPQKIRNKHIFPIEKPDYTDKEGMLDSMLNNAYVYRRFLVLELDRMVYEEKYFNSRMSAKRAVNV
ncbi:hypothetical protein [uncultured Desulfosarcina sp.]|uniref:hypothetical protein n=1 Tax=uncultured Desulfosarcina sp. TaxID=218289 RepID=UPI0029C7E494|nr:hypothetical protein [uncultured Desulfosarcina sp.]